MCAKSLQLCLTLCDTMDCSPPGNSVHGILQARILEWVAMPFFRGSSWPRDWTHISMSPVLADMLFTTSTTLEAQILTYYNINESWRHTKWNKSITKGQNTIWFHTYGGMMEYIETGSRMVGRGIELAYNENRVLVGEDEKFWRWTVVIVVQHEYT